MSNMHRPDPDGRAPGIQHDQDPDGGFGPDPLGAQPEATAELPLLHEMAPYLEIKYTPPADPDEGVTPERIAVRSRRLNDFESLWERGFHLAELQHLANPSSEDPNDEMGMKVTKAGLSFFAKVYETWDDGVAIVEIVVPWHRVEHFEEAKKELAAEAERRKERDAREQEAHRRQQFVALQREFGVDGKKGASH